jgi:predicted ATPase/class 3 adenylate cyclase
VRVLGSVSVEVDGRGVPVGGPLPRRLLAVLLANRGATLSVERLVEVLWGDEPPEAATSSLQTYVSRLRRLLPPSVRLETAAPGYRLRLEPGAADVERFEAALGEALACLAERPEAALAGLEAALGCWRGDAFAEFGEEWWAQGEAARLEELRLHAREAHADALLGLGRSEAAVSEARAVTADHPSRERAWRTLVLGLHRSGRQRDALRAAGEYRARLRDDSGLDPSSEFAVLEHAVAVDDPQLRTTYRQLEPAALDHQLRPVPTQSHSLRSPPIGTVSFLFTDIEGSTSLWERDPGAMRRALGRHDEIVRDSVAAHGGYMFATGGDGFGVAFGSPEAAVAAALEAQRGLVGEVWPSGLDLRVRMGVHTGVAHERGGDYFGPTLNRAARLMSAAHGGQLVVSAAVAELTRDCLGEEVAVLDLGEHAFRGLSRPEHVFQLSAAGLTEVFAGLRTGSMAKGNLPTPATSFVGRVQQLKWLSEQLESRRLVTVVGTGGVGKTRLAIEAAHACGGELPDGAWWVELAPVGDPAAVGHAAAAALSVRLREGGDPVDAVVEALSRRRMLLVLDNAEHVLAAAADLVARVLAGAPDVVVLVTSREPLGLPSEQVWPLDPLEPTLEGVELFYERAALADASFTPSEADGQVIADVCGRLDGMPLAIELAAARIRSLSPADLAQRLDDRFRLLRGSRRGAVERHQTLRATIDWSYRLLDASERLLFDRLSVFAGTFDLAAVEAVCGVGEDLDPLDVLDGLSALVDKSLVVTDHQARPARYRLLETLRQYGAERLDERAETDLLRSRHLAHYVDVAEQARDAFQGDDPHGGVARFDANWDNLRAALGWAVATDDASTAEKLVVAPYWYAVWYLRHELGAFARQAGRITGINPAVLGIDAAFSWFGGDVDAAQALGETGIAAAADVGHPDAAICRQVLINCYASRGQADEMRRVIAPYSTAAADLSDNYDAATLLALLAEVAQFADPAAADALVALAKRRAAGLANPPLRAWIAVVEGVVAFGAGRRAEAAVLLREAKLLSEEGGPYLRAYMAFQIALRAASPGFDIDPVAAYDDAVSRLYEMREWGNLWLTIESLAGWWARSERLEQAAVALGHLDAAQRHWTAMADRRAIATAAVSQHPDGARWAARGAALSRDQLVDYVLEELDPLRSNGGQ